MNDLLMLLAENALLLVAGTTLLLSLGCGAAMLCKSPVHRQRIAELTIAGVLGWMVLALLPLPRLLPLAVSRDSQVVTTAQSSEIPATAPLMVSDMTEVAREDASLDDFQGLHGPASPSYVPSPSEELPPVANQSPTSPAQEAEPAATPFTWHFDRTQLVGLFTGVYLAGAVLCVLWILAGHVILLRIRFSAEAPPRWLVEQYQSLAEKTGIPPPQLIVSRLCSRPLTWGVLWPVVVLPHSLCRPENKSQLCTILLHELGHIAQQDAQGNLLFCAALPLLYAHPLFWWLRRESQLAAELVADDWAAQQTGKETYVEELVALARCTSTSSLPLIGVTGLFSSPSQFYRRMQMLLAREKPLSTRTSLPWRLASLSALAGSVALAASLAGVRPAAGQTEQPVTPSAPAVELVPTTPATPPPNQLIPAATPQSGRVRIVVPALGPLPVDVPPAGIRFDFPPRGTSPVTAPPAAVAQDSEAGNQLPAPALDPEEAALIAEVKALHSKLQALEEKRRTSKPDHPKAGIKAVDIRTGTHTLGLVRVDEQGVTWSEIWSLDEKGQPAKILSRSGLSVLQPPHLADLSADRKITTKEYVEQDGSRRTVIVDSATGKIVGETRTAETRLTPLNDTSDDLGPTNKPGKPMAEQVPIVEYPIVGKRPSVVATTPPANQLFESVVAHPTGVPNTAHSDRQLDLVSLATSYADAVSAREAAAARMDDIAKLGDSNAISQHEARSAELALRAAARKEQLLQSIAKAAMEGAAREVERTAELHNKGVINSSAMAEAETRLVILKQILGTQPPAKVPVPSKR